jgi:OFA family oxalate/formate antiporter-like MFS transporter
VPVATLIKWFPDKRGFITGIAVAGFGGGAFVTAFVARGLVASSGPFSAFAILGIIYLVMVVGAALFMKNPPEGYRPPGWEPEESGGGGDSSGANYDLGGALKTWQFFWAWLSDAIGRKWVFFVMFLLQAVLLVLLPVLGASFVLLSILAFVIVSCYGGGFGTMPAFSADYFGSANVGKIYGLMLTAWSFGGVLGPLLISRVIDSTDSYSLAFFILAGIMAASAIVAFIVRPPRRGSEVTAAQPEGARA